MNHLNPSVITSVPVLDFATGHVVRYLTETDIDDSLLVELSHDNIRSVYSRRTAQGESLSYTTKEMGGSTIAVNKSIRYPQGDLGVADVSADVAHTLNHDLHKMACCYALSAGYSYDESSRIFTIPSSCRRWQVVPVPQADCSITLRFRGQVLGSVGFRRIWPSSSAVPS